MLQCVLSRAAQASLFATYAITSDYVKNHKCQRPSRHGYIEEEDSQTCLLSFAQLSFSHFQFDACESLSQAVVCWLDHCCLQIRR